MLDYTLAVLTHGDMGPLDQSLNSFRDKVKPAPARVIIHADGTAPTLQKEWTVTGHEGWQLRMGPEQRGFCRATEALWKWATDPEEATEFTFWLEHDFVFLRPVDLGALAIPLRNDSKLAQMQLMRTAVSVPEIDAGGLYESRPGEYEPVVSAPGINRWLRHRSYFSTNPSLMRTAWMRENPWPDDDEPQCEGRFGIGLVQGGFHFGVWGAGEPWVEHVGLRTGFGY